MGKKKQYRLKKYTIQKAEIAQRDDLARRSRLGDAKSEQCPQLL